MADRADADDASTGDASLPHDFGRRGFLRFVAGGALAAPFVGACSGDDESGATTTGPSTTTGGGAAPPSLAPAVPANVETWTEPWVWRPSDWPGQQLDLNVVENENPGPIVGAGNASAVLFSYNGGTPGPTIRMRGDETLFVRLRNHLGLDRGTTYVGPFPDPAGGARPPYFTVAQAQDKATSRAEALEERSQPRQDFCLGEHTNGVHSLHVTNLHTHGLHVRPGRNADGTHSDNVILRLTNQSDFKRREDSALSPACDFLRDPEQDGYLQVSEQVGYADYEFRLGDVQAAETERLGVAPQAHPPGTHWYHPHAHGATHNQVASGMAGFLIVEGDVDEALNDALTGQRHPDPQTKTGHYGYIERLMFIQRVSALTNPSRDSDSGADSTLQQTSRDAVFAAINGDQSPKTIVMQQGDIERWRVLNGSVDGRGYKRFMVLQGDFQVQESANGLSRLTRRDPSGEYSPVSRQQTEDAKVDIAQLAFDGVTLVTGTGDDARYTIKDLSVGRDDPLNLNPLNAPFDPQVDPNLAMLENIENCFVDADAVRRCYVRPNEVYMAPANRTDILFRAPDEVGVYTVLAKAVIMHGDNYEASLQATARRNRTRECEIDDRPLANAPEDIVVAYVRVESNTREPLPARDPDDPCKNVAVDSFDDLVDCLPPLPRYLRPIDDDEVLVADGDPDASLHAGSYRTRTVTYSGWGSADFPLVTTVESDEPNSFQDPAMAAAFRRFVEDDQAKHGGSVEDLVYTQIKRYDGEPVIECKNGVATTSYPDPDNDRWHSVVVDGEKQYVLLPSQLRTMAITASTAADPVGGGVVPANRGRKFGPSDPQRPKMLSGTAEEWVLRNDSMMLWADVNPEAEEQPVGQFGAHYSALPMTRASARAERTGNPNWEIVTKGVDHPFHIHQNPCWVMRIEIPDADGNLVNILDEPRWQDVIWIPRNTGRVVFRSRFPDFVGEYVEHCHLLLHEDNGMMQVIEVTPFADEANYDPADTVVGATGGADVPRHTLDEAWSQSMQFFDPNHSTGQDYPGFPVSPPINPFHDGGTADITQ